MLAACGGDSAPDLPTETATVLAEDTATPAPNAATPRPADTPTATETPTPPPPDEDLVRQLGRSAAYIIYTAAQGDTLARVAHMFGGVPGPSGTLFAFWEELQELNSLGSGPLEFGQIVAVPLQPASTAELALSSEGLWLWLTENGTKDLEMYWPTERLVNDGYQGALTAQSVEVHFDDETGVATGYSVQFAETDRPVFKGGGLDPAVVVVGRAFDVHCGPIITLLDPLPTDSVQSFGEQCMVTAPRGDLDAQVIAGQLALARAFVD